MAKYFLDGLKFDVLQELSYIPPVNSESQYRQALDNFKWEVSREIGVPLQPGYNGDLTAREAGRLGGRLGGPIGGHMVRRMILAAEQSLTRQA